MKVVILFDDYVRWGSPFCGFLVSLIFIYAIIVGISVDLCV